MHQVLTRNDKKKTTRFFKKNKNHIFLLYFSWFHGRLDRKEAEDRLRKASKPGSFLVRESDRRTGSFVLSYLSLKSTIYHFKYIILEYFIIKLYDLILS
jgi:hypothetical protein